jgi:hydroxymethylbilane synthase
MRERASGEAEARGAASRPGAPARLRIGTRASPLALWQARHVGERLVAMHAGLEVELVEIRTSGERFAEQSLQQMGTGIFTAEIDAATLDGRVDVGVHSLKDLPTEPHPGLCLAAVPERESALDAWICASGQALEELPPRSRIGTSSPRRAAQLLHLRADLTIVPLRGNVETRLGKVQNGDVAGTVLAHAGLRRLGYEERIVSLLPAERMVPAVGQGALAVVARCDRAGVVALVAAIEDPVARACVEAERGFLRVLRGGCQVPAGALATLAPEGDGLRIEALVASLDGAQLLRAAARGAVRDAGEVGARVARELIERGARRILAGFGR